MLSIKTWHSRTPQLVWPSCAASRILPWRDNGSSRQKDYQDDSFFIYSIVSPSASSASSPSETISAIKVAMRRPLVVTVYVT